MTADFLAFLIAYAAWAVILLLAVAVRLIVVLVAGMTTKSKPALPPDTLIEIGDGMFTPAEANKIVSLRDYWQGRAVGNGAGGDAA